jgi:hypothetical protein
MPRLPGPGGEVCVPCASGGCTVPPPPRGGRSGRKTGAGRSGSGAGGVSSGAPGTGAVVPGPLASAVPVLGCVAGSSGSARAATGGAGGRSGGWTDGLAALGASDTGGGCSFSSSCGSGLTATAASLWSELSASCGCPLEASLNAWESTPEPVRRRFSSIATSSSIELECVFFSCTPISGSISSMTPGFTSSSRASSLIRIFLIEATAR